MAKTYRPPLPAEQDLLLPPSLRDWLPEDHLAYFVSDLVDQLDLSAITEVYENEDRGYGASKGMVEPVIGQIKQARGFRQFLLRGVEKVQREWSLVCATHNILKLYRLCV